MPKRYILILLLAAVALSGCGLKGDLYLPTEPPPQAETTAPDTAAETTAESEETEDAGARS